MSTENSTRSTPTVNFGQRLFAEADADGIDVQVTPQPEVLQYGSLALTTEELLRVAECTYRGELAEITPGVPRSEEDLRELRRFEGAFDEAGGASSLYALRHWAGGALASVGDLRLVALWVGSLRRAAVELGIDWNAVDSNLARVWSHTSVVMRGDENATTPAANLAHILDALADEVAEYVVYEPDTGEFSGLEEVLPLLGWLEKFYEGFSQGPDDQGRFLSDEFVWDCLAGPAPS